MTSRCRDSAGSGSRPRHQAVKAAKSGVATNLVPIPPDLPECIQNCFREAWPQAPTHPDIKACTLIAIMLQSALNKPRYPDTTTVAKHARAFLRHLPPALGFAKGTLAGWALWAEFIERAKKTGMATTTLSTDDLIGEQVNPAAILATLEAARRAVEASLGALDALTNHERFEVERCVADHARHAWREAGVAVSLSEGSADQPICKFIHSVLRAMGHHSNSPETISRTLRDRPGRRR